MSFLGNLFGGGPSNNQKQANNLLNSAAETGLNVGGNFLRSSQNAFQAPTSYYSSILSGNPAAVSGALAPELSQLNAGYRNARTQLDQFAPMGGGRASMISQLPFEQQSAITNLIAQQRALAAQGLTGIGGTMGGIGANLVGIGTNAAGIMGSQAFEQALRNQQVGQSVGQGIGSIIAGMGLF
jgi:hypothetical protein